MKKTDFSELAEPKPEVLRNSHKSFPEKHVVDRNKQDLMSFFNVSPKTRVAATISALGILLFVLSLYTGAFQNKQLDSLYPKEQSQASQPRTHNAPTEPSFGFSAFLPARMNQKYEINLTVNTGTESATIMAAQIKYDPQYFEVEAVLTQDSVVDDWIDNNVSNGVVSLVGSFPKGYVTKPGDLLATLVLVPKMTGQTELYYDQKNSHIYRMGDKKEIMIKHDRMQVGIE